MSTYQYYKDIFSGQSMPFSYLDLDLLDANIHQVLESTQNKSIRIATKSIRSIEIINYILNSDLRFQGLMCFTAKEALYLAENKLDDLLVAYPVWDEKDIHDVAAANCKGHKIILTVDDIRQIEKIAAIAKEYNIELPLCLDVDMSVQFPGLYFGVRRSPITTVEQVVRLAALIKQNESLYLDGILGYEAEIAGVIDYYPRRFLQNFVIRQLKLFAIKKIAKKREAIINQLISSGVSVRFVNGGGTGSISSTCNESSVSEITVGSAFYDPILFDYYKEFSYQPAAGFAVEIVRQPTVNIYTCLGGGYIGSGAVGKEKSPQPFQPKGARLLPLEGAGEVQTPIYYQGPDRITLGDPLFMRHSKAGELCERFDQLLTIRDGKIVGKARTYRGDGYCFL